MTEELKNCPFCGEEAKIGSLKGDKENWAIWCGSCGIPCSEKSTREETIQAWNTRVKPAFPSVEEINKVIRNHPSNECFSKYRVLVDVEDTVKAIHALMKGEK